jgi:hydroxysqualene synthase
MPYLGVGPVITRPNFLPKGAVLQKQAKDESFPVASRFLSPQVRSEILAFYAFARSADDLADTPGSDGHATAAALDAVEAALVADGSGDTLPSVECAAGSVSREAMLASIAAAGTLGKRLRARGLSDRPARDLLVAFRRDALGHTCGTWSDLMDYCRWSAAPVGRFLLELHAEDDADAACSDALCAALQIVNHVQDCGRDYRDLNRIYLPSDVLTNFGVPASDLGAAQCSVELRGALNYCLDGADQLLDGAAGLPDSIADRRLRAQSRAAIEAGRRLSVRLRKRDPLAARVDLSVEDRLMIGMTAMVALVRSRRARNS